MADGSAPTTQPQAEVSIPETLKLDPGNQYHCPLTFSSRTFSFNFHLQIIIVKKYKICLLCGTPVAVFCVEILNKLTVSPPVGSTLELPWGHRALVWTAVWTCRGLGVGEVGRAS